MKRRQFIAASTAVLATSLHGTGKEEKTGKPAGSGLARGSGPVRRIAPRGRCRIFYVSDPSSIATNFFPDPVREDDLRRWVDMLADSGVDMFDQEVYSQGWTVYWRSPKFEYERRIQHRRFIPLLDAGIQPLNVLIDQTHKRGMTFIAGFRMNDDHAYLSRQQGVGIARFIEDHPQWKLPAENTPYAAEALDFTFNEVRDFVFQHMEEVASLFDVEGLEMCFRDHTYFPVNKGRERAHLMTDLVQKIRAMLDRQGKAKGRKLLLGARVYNTLNKCHDMGLDVPTWVSKGLIDYLSPADPMYADFNLPYEEFAALTRNSQCMLYPGMLPWSSPRARRRLGQIPLSPASQRALAQTFYGAGADGISLYNHFTMSSPMGHAPFYPQHMRNFHELRDPEKVAAGERHYIFDPSLQTGPGADGLLPPTGAMKDKLVLDRNVPNPKGEYRFHLYEDLAQSYGSTLLFRGFGLTCDDELEVRLNGRLIPDAAVGRTRASNPPVDGGHVHQVGGRSVRTIPEQGRIEFRKQPEPSFSTRWFDLKGQQLAWGENVLALTLTKGDPQASGQILLVVDEVEIFVQPKQL